MLTDLLLTACSVCFLLECRTTSSGIAPPTVDWALLYQLLFKKEPFLSYYSQILLRIFFSQVALPSVDYSSGQVDRKLTSTLEFW